MTKCKDRSGPKWGGKIHRRTIHSLSAVTIAAEFEEAREFVEGCDA